MCVVFSQQMSQSILRLIVSITETVFRPAQTEILQLELIYLSVMKMDSIYHSSAMVLLDIVGVWTAGDRKEQEPGLHLVHLT
ncbi:hypothetical protein XENOCAPTIV_012714 [Xenoophorus captivus]|uniref:Uncharacterized protein n=1 Tax=Xenoophorus captivus TaxID=1517983 RepID=A0ABV0QLU0_9TELE